MQRTSTNHHDHLTDVAYWDAPREAFTPTVIKRSPYIEAISRFLPANRNWTAAELGAYPGNQLCYLAAHKGYHPVAIDFSEHQDHIHAMFAPNGVAGEVIQADVTQFSGQQFNVVCSFGLIEHFTNLDAIISKHIELTKPGGIVAISVPAWTPLQRWARECIYTRAGMQRIDQAHNASAMRLDRLRACFAQQPVELLHAGYGRKAELWIEASSPNLRPWAKPICALYPKLHRAMHWMIPNSGMWSPSIFIVARKLD